ncbi:hypothetical protein [Salipiger mucosus]|uniref:hypothetical protein n=1 Tax=Salipiger mucosus TaxID=263378 RepID=UPI001C30C013|nr:hypothetical protein [Salipiger mucosus]
MADMSYAMYYNKALAEKALDNVERWKAHCADLENTIRGQKDQIDAWNMHYLGLEAERDYLLTVLDDRCGGANKNPARELTNEELRIPNGARKGQRLQKRDVVYLKKVRELAQTRFKQWSDWWDLIRGSRIFD